MNIIEKLSQEFNIKVEHVEKTVELIDEGNTIPFIARYRKEVTGSLDDNILRDLNDRLNFLRNIEKRKQEVFDLISAQEKMTPEIEAAIQAAVTITEVDDIYRPYRPHHRDHQGPIFFQCKKIYLYLPLCLSRYIQTNIRLRDNYHHLLRQ